MIGVESETDVKITATDVIEADKKRRMDAASLGFSISQERVPEDRGVAGLKGSGFQPELRSDGSIVYGYTAPHAEPQEYGTGPFWPPAKPLVEWAERIGKDKGFGYYVQWKIAQEGIDGTPYLRPSAERMDKWLKSHDLSEYL